jgi:hypothetical protein
MCVYLGILKHGEKMIPETSIEKAQYQQIAKTIISQIKAMDYWSLAAWGARNYVSYAEGEQGEIGYILGGVQFDVSGHKVKGKVIVYLMGDDTYTVRVIKVRGMKVTEVALIKNVYCEDMMSVIDGIVEH